jgi:hypothetical protein
MKSRHQLCSLVYFLCLTTPALATTRYVDLNNAAPAPPYTNWPAAATNIQDAIDASSAGDLILVTNGIYNTGSRTANDSTPCRLVIDKPVTVSSVNGPEATVIQGYSLPGQFPFSLNSVRCAYMTNGTTLIGFKLSQGSVQATTYRNLSDDGGGVWCESTTAVLSNCVIIDCSAYAGGGGDNGTYINCLITNGYAHIGGGGVIGGNLDRSQVVWGTSDYYGGGIYVCNATNCLLIDNLGLFGGGAYGGTLNNCTVYGNYADANGSLGGGYGGGGDNSLIYNSIIYYNDADSDGANVTLGAYTNCCSAPLPDGSGNFTNEPGFVNMSAGNWRLQSNSPCIDTGNNAFSSGLKDLDNRSRIVGAKVDVGAFEFQGPDLSVFINWLWSYSLPTDGSADYSDPDGDGMNNWQEWKAGTSPVDYSSCLRIVSLAVLPSSTQIGWASVTARNYTLERSTNLAAPTPFQTMASNIPGQPGSTFFTDTNITGPGACFYRVLIQ